MSTIVGVIWNSLLMTWYFENVSNERNHPIRVWKGKLSLRCIRPFKIKSRVGIVPYRLELPLELYGIRNVFHVSML